MKRKHVILIAVVLAIPGAVYLRQRFHRTNDLVLTGIVTTDEVSVSAEIQGRLSQLRVKEGDTVQQHQLLAVIEPQELKADAEYYSHTEEGQSAAVREAEASLKYQELQTRDQIHQAEAALSATQAQRAEAAATLEQNRLDFERAESLYKQGIDSRQVYDQARTTYEAAKAHLDSLEKQVQAQRAALALAESNAEQVAMRRSQLLAQEHQLAAAAAQKDKAQVRLGYTEIRAPIDGLVSERAALQGEVVNIGQPIVALINPDDLWVRVDVEETYIDRIRLGDKMSVRFPSGRERTGTVFYRGADADYATQRDVSRTKRDIKTFEIRLHVDNHDRRLYPGLTAYVTVPVGAP